MPTLQKKTQQNRLVSCGHTPFRKRGKGSANFPTEIYIEQALRWHNYLCIIISRRLTKYLLMVSQL